VIQLPRPAPTPVPAPVPACHVVAGLQIMSLSAACGQTESAYAARADISLLLMLPARASGACGLAFALYPGPGYVIAICVSEASG
jgi:hypothetical protein